MYSFGNRIRVSRVYKLQRCAFDTLGAASGWTPIKDRRSWIFWKKSQAYVRASGHAIAPGRQPRTRSPSAGEIKAVKKRSRTKKTRRRRKATSMKNEEKTRGWSWRRKKKRARKNWRRTGSSRRKIRRFEGRVPLCGDGIEGGQWGGQGAAKVAVRAADLRIAAGECEEAYVDEARREKMAVVVAAVEEEKVESTRA